MQEYHNTFFVDEINLLSKNDPELLVSMSEEMYHDQINELIEEVLNKKSIKVILLAGPSSSGKTTTSNLIKLHLKEKNVNSISVSLDDFFLNRDQTPLLPNGKYDYENITALDLDCFNKFVDDLFFKNKAQMPTYNFKTGKREEKLSEIEIDDNTIVIIEGLHALNPMLITGNEEKLFRVYICALSNFSCDDNIIIDYTSLRLMRRLIRDYYHRNRTLEQTMETWQEVLEGERLYIDPYKHLVDFKIDSTHMYEPLLFANYLLPLLEKSKINLFELESALKKCNKLDKKILPKNSLLNEFFTV